MLKTIVDAHFRGENALQFPNSGIVLLTRLCERRHAIVLQLPASPSFAHLQAMDFFARGPMVANVLS